MGKLALFSLIMKLIPIVLMIIGEVNAAKEDDGKVDTTEIAAIIKRTVDALKDEFMSEIK